MEVSNRAKWWVIGLVVVFIILVARWYQQQSTRNIVNTVYIGEGLSIAGLFKSALSEYYLTHDSLPSSNKEVGLDLPERYASNALQRAEITAKGEIKLSYDAKSGVAGGVIRLIPTAVPGMIKWRCETADYPDIAEHIPQCQYQPNDNVNVVTEQIVQHDDVPAEKATNVATTKNSVQCDSSHEPMLLDGLFTRQIVNSKPVDHLQSLGLRQQDLYFYSTIVGGSQQRISHRWLLNNQPVQEQTFVLGFDQFPIWSKQPLGKEQGDWEVQVWAEGCLLDRFTIAYASTDEAQTIGVIDRQKWQRPKDVIDSVIIDSAKALIPPQNFVIESWIVHGSYWRKEAEASGIYSDDITNNIRAGNLAIFKDSRHQFNHDRRNISGDTPLIEAIKAGQQAIAISLIHTGANPFVRGVDGSRPYSLAVKNNMPELKAAIINYAETQRPLLHGKEHFFAIEDLNNFMIFQKWQQRNALGDTPLLLAAREDNDWAVAALLQINKNTNLFINDRIGKRANDIARDNNNLLATDLIEKQQHHSKAPWQVIESSISTGLKGDHSLDCVEKHAVAANMTFYYFNRVMDTDLDTLHHKWFYQNRLIKDVLPNKGSRENTLFSTHTLTELDKGIWTVELTNGQGDVLDRMRLVYGEKGSNPVHTPLSNRCVGASLSLLALIEGWQDPKLITEKLDTLDNFNRSAPLALSTAIKVGNISAVRMILDRSQEPEKLLNALDYRSSLLLAIKNNNPVMVKYLLHRGANVNQQNSSYSYPPIFEAVVESNHQIISILLKAGADPTLLSKHLGALPLIQAANNCDIDSMKLLVAHGARFDQKNKQGLTAQDFVARDCRKSKNLEQIKLLIEQEQIS